MTFNYFHTRFDNGVFNAPGANRITDGNSEALFSPRDEGLHLLMINAPIREWSYPNIMPLGHGYVGSVAVMDGHRLSVLDLNAERKEPVKDAGKEFEAWIDNRVRETLAKLQPDVIGLGGIITQYGRLRRIAQVCREALPNIKIILGGGIGSSMPEFMLERMPIDAVILEEGEVTISELLARYEAGQSLKGVAGTAYREVESDGSISIIKNGLRPSLHSREAGLDNIPWPMRSKWPIHETYKRNPIGHLNWESKWKDGASTDPNSYSVSMLASRGCPYAIQACDYCYASYLGQQYRLRSPREVVDEMQVVQAEYGVKYIHFLDDLLMTDYRWALELFNELEARRKSDGFEVEWGGTCRTNIIANDIIRARKEGRANILERGYEVGMRQAGYGVETGSPTILKSIDKSGQTPEKIKIAIEETQRVLGYADCSFMIGSPGETQETVRETVDLCKDIGLAPEVFFFTTAYPATAFWQLALDKGLIAKAVTGTLGPANDDMIERYFLKLGEQGEEVRTNFSDMPDQEVIDLSWWAVSELGAQNTVRHPHTGEEQKRGEVRTASHADV
jgi:anaerobic magnesium-protoporphyrin IX monomethyl ester cyclase